MDSAQTIAEIFHDWGWAGAIIFLLFERGLPFIKEAIVPEYRANRDRQAKAYQEERERIRILEERQAMAFDKIAAAVEQLVVSTVLTNEKVSQLSTDLAAHDQRTLAAVSELRKENVRPVKRGGIERTN